MRGNALYEPKLLHALQAELDADAAASAAAARRRRERERSLSPLRSRSRPEPASPHSTYAFREPSFYAALEQQDAAQADERREQRAVGAGRTSPRRRGRLGLASRPVAEVHTATSNSIVDMQWSLADVRFESTKREAREGMLARVPASVAKSARLEAERPEDRAALRAAAALPDEPAAEAETEIVAGSPEPSPRTRSRLTATRIPTRAGAGRKAVRSPERHARGAEASVLSWDEFRAHHERSRSPDVLRTSDAASTYGATSPPARRTASLRGASAELSLVRNADRVNSSVSFVDDFTLSRRSGDKRHRFFEEVSRSVDASESPPIPGHEWAEQRAQSRAGETDEEIGEGDSDLGTPNAYADLTAALSSIEVPDTGTAGSDGYLTRSSPPSSVGQEMSSPTDLELERSVERLAEESKRAPLRRASSPVRLRSSPSPTRADSPELRQALDGTLEAETARADSAVGAVGDLGQRPSEAVPPREPRMRMASVATPAVLPDGEQLCFTVHVISARNLAKMDRGRRGKSDPYCVLRCGNDEHRTKVIRKTLSPEWKDARFQFDGARSSGELTADLFDWDRGSKDEPMGRVTVPLVTMDGKKHWFELQSMPRCRKPQGELQMRCTLMPGMPDRKQRILEPQPQPEPEPEPEPEPGPEPEPEPDPADMLAAGTPPQACAFNDSH